MDDTLITRLGDELFDALRGSHAIVPLTERHPHIGVEAAYAVQQRLIDRRRASGARPVGKKIGVTSKAVMSMLGVAQPDFGVLLDDMVHDEGECVSMRRFIQPRIEGEIAFVLKRDLRGPGLTAADVLRATEGVMACFEIVDSRIQDWKIKIQDTVADNASCGAFVLGSQLVDPREVDLVTCGMVLEHNGEVAVTGAGAATMSSPVSAVVWLANTLGRLGTGLATGEVILSGALGAMVPVRPGDAFHLRIGGIGACSVRFSA